MATFLVQLGLQGVIAVFGFLLGFSTQFIDQLTAKTPMLLVVAALVIAAGAGSCAWMAALARQRRASRPTVSHGRGEHNRPLVARDALTGLPNRTALFERLHGAVGGVRRADRMVAVLAVDLAGFKDINETLGHAAGDLLLRHGSARMLGCVRETDTVARVGTDAFAIVQTDVGGPRDPERLSERLLAAMADPFDLHGESVEVGLCVGVALAGSESIEPEALWRHAGAALGRARRDGPNTVRFFERAMDADRDRRRTLAQDLRHALDRGELAIHYQPQFALASRRLVAVEALLRWHHPQYGLIAPDQLVPLAEDRQLIVPIGAWVLDQACRQATLWQKGGAAGLRLAVDVSPVQTRDADFVTLVEATLQHTGLEEQHLELEITESLLSAGAGPAAVEQLRSRGIRIAIDDFGGDHSSLGTMRRLAVDGLKVDRSVVAALGRDPSALAIVRAALGLGRSLDLEVAADGVETAEQLAVLEAEGCRLAQGSFFSPPVAPREIDAIVKATVTTPPAQVGESKKTA